jgi:hypothetical protein
MNFQNKKVTEAELAFRTKTLEVKKASSKAAQRAYAKNPAFKPRLDFNPKGNTPQPGYNCLFELIWTEYQYFGSVGWSGERKNQESDSWWSCGAAEAVSLAGLHHR